MLERLTDFSKVNYLVNGGIQNILHLVSLNSHVRLQSELTQHIFKSKIVLMIESGPEYSLEGLMLKLKPQYFGHLM